MKLKKQCKSLWSIFLLTKLIRYFTIISRIRTLNVNQKSVWCINYQAHNFQENLMTLPDCVKNFYPNLSVESARKIFQDILKVEIYSGNSNHLKILRNAGKCTRNSTVPLILTRDVQKYTNDPRLLKKSPPDISTNNMKTKIAPPSRTSDPAVKRMKTSIKQL